MPPSSAPSAAPPRWLAPALLGLLVLALGYRLDAPPLFDDPNDGQYAEVAREMAESGEWITPQLNGVPFLNKPPLLYWMIAAAYRAFGVHEWAARLPGAVATLLAALLLYRLGCTLADPLVGVLAAVTYATLPGTLIEARFVRPDTWLVAATIGALLAFALALQTSGRRQRRAWLGWQLALALGVLAKGVVGLLLPGVAMAVVIVAERRFDVLRRLARPRQWWLFALLIVPWHAVAAARHSGFAWDYMVNQHVLFFLDLKVPRDSEGIPLLAFWGAFAARALPWTPLVPLAVVAGVRGARNADRLALLAVGWATGTLAFFSAAPSRLEHYALPALPALALLVARRLRAPGRLVQVHVAVTVAGLGLGAWVGPGVLARVDWLRDLEALPGLARVFALAVSLAGIAAVGLMRRVPYAPILALGLVTVALVPLVHRGLVAIAPINSSAPVAALIKHTDPDATVVFEAPTEYQSAAGLAFYLRRRLTLLEPPGFVDPPYLRPHHLELFIDRAQLGTLWAAEPVVFVSDPLAPASRTPAELVPEPRYVLGRIGTRLVITNQPPGAARPRPDL